MNKLLGVMLLVVTGAALAAPAHAQDDPELTPTPHMCGAMKTNVPCDRLNDFHHGRWSPNGGYEMSPEQYEVLNKPAEQMMPEERAVMRKQYEGSQRALPLKNSGNPTKDGWLDVEAFNNREWQAAPNRSPWVHLGDIGDDAIYYSYSSFGRQGAMETYVAMKLAKRALGGHFTSLNFMIGQIVCEQGSYPRVVLGATVSSYNADTGYPLSSDASPREDVPIGANSALAAIVMRVCDIVNKRAVR